MQYMDNNIKKKREMKRDELNKYLRENAKNMAMLEMDDDQIALAERRGDWNLSGYQQFNQGGSPFSRKRSLAKKKDMKLHTMNIEQFLTHIHVAKENNDNNNSPTKMTEHSKNNLDYDHGQDVRSGSERRLN